MSLFELSQRQETKAKNLRKQGFIPVGLVERDHHTVPLQISKQQFKEATHGGGHTQIEIRVDGEKGSRKAILKNIDMDPISREILAITMQAVSGEDMVKMDVPVVGVGDNEDAKAGGVTLTLVTDHLKLRGRVDAMPEVLTVDVSSLPAGGTITASEVALPEGIELLNSADTIVFSNTIDKEPELEPEAEEAEGEAEAEGTGEAQPSDEEGAQSE
ncbi:MAG TPA: 50S ribosomal protein L25 [Fimbriimonas sp.]